MKHKLLAGALILGLIAGINSSAFAAAQRILYKSSSHQDDRIRVWTDPYTGCQYIIIHGNAYQGSSITARLGRDARPICRQ